jgi:ankyrin repeat protein
VDLLISKGADVNAKDKYGNNAVVYAINEGHTDIAALLKAHGAV